MPQDPTWQRDPKHQQYSLTAGDSQALVWSQPTGKWAALISRGHTAIATGTFKTLEDAQSWCQAQLAKQRAITP